MPEIDDIATCRHQPLWCTELGIISPVNEVVEFNDPTYRIGVSWPQSYRAIIFAVDPGPVMYATELVIVQDDFPEFYVCSTTGGERTFSAFESKALPRKSLETVTLTRSACKMNRQQTLNNFVNLNGREYPENASISFQCDPITVIKSTEVRGRVGSEIKMQCMGNINCSEYPSGVKWHHSPWMTKDMCEKQNKRRPEDMHEKHEFD